jgi:ABC-type lipoprotein export system ATPase subunit
LQDFSFNCADFLSDALFAETAPMARQFIYHMQGLTKTYTGGKKVLDNVHLQFYPDAKIGVLGPNGAGKSSLLKIMAGIDKEWQGEAWVAEGAKVGYLEQEPQLDDDKTVRENVMAGVAEKTAIIERYNELMMNYSDETADEGAALQDQIDAEGLWDLDAKVDMAMDALRCPAPDADVKPLSGGERRRVALCRLAITLLIWKRKRNAWSRRAASRIPACVSWIASANGWAPAPKPVRPSQKPVSTSITNWWRPQISASQPIRRSLSRLQNVSARW